MPVIIFILVLSFLVIIHELGHFLAAKKCGVDVEEFGLGYPPRAIKLFSWRGTDFTLNLIPFGGFVKLAGENDTEEERKSKKKKTGQFYQASIKQRLAVILTAPLVNFLFGVFAFAGLFAVLGIPQPLSPPIIEEIGADSPAAAVNLPIGVKVLGFESNGQYTATPTIIEVQEYVLEHMGETVLLSTSGPCQNDTCEESGNSYEVYLRTAEETPGEQGSLGVIFATVHYSLPEQVARGVVLGLEQSIYLSYQILIALGDAAGQAFTGGQVPEALTGPIGIAHQAQVGGFLSDLPSIISFAAMLSINLAILNALPIMPLDGGQALFIALEAFVQKKTLHTLRLGATYAGYGLMLLLMVVVTARDVLRIIVPT